MSSRVQNHHSIKQGPEPAQLRACSRASSGEEKLGELRSHNLITSRRYADGPRQEGDVPWSRHSTAQTTERTTTTTLRNHLEGGGVSNCVRSFTYAPRESSHTSCHRRGYGVPHRAELNGPTTGVIFYFIE